MCPWDPATDREFTTAASLRRLRALSQAFFDPSTVTMPGDDEDYDVFLWRPQPLGHHLDTRFLDDFDGESDDGIEWWRPGMDDAGLEGPLDRSFMLQEKERAPSCFRSSTPSLIYSLSSPVDLGDIHYGPPHTQDDEVTGVKVIPYKISMFFKMCRQKLWPSMRDN